MAQKYWILFLVLNCSLVLVSGNPTPRESGNSENEIENSAPDLDVSAFAKCSYKNGMAGLINCAAIRALTILQQATKRSIIEIFPGITLISENSQNEREGKTIQDKIPLPSEDTKEGTDKLLVLIADAAGRFFSGRTLKIKLPEINSAGFARAIEEGRGKMKKGGMMSPILLGIAAKFILIKGLMLAGTALMAIKALVLSKIAFVLAVIFGAQSLFGGSFNLKDLGGFPNKHGWVGGGWNGGSGSYGPPYGTPQNTWTTNNIGGWGNQYPYARSIDDVKEDELIDTRTTAQELAYSEQRQ